MSRLDLERAVLATLIFRPQYFEQAELSPALFTPGRFRKTYELISELWETTRAEISLPVLAQRIGGEEPASFVSGLVDGLHHFTSEQFLQSIEELRWIRRTREIGRDLAHELALEEKTGIPDRTSWERIFEKVEGLRKSATTRTDSNIRTLANIQSEEIEWLWPGRIPFGMLTLLAGSPGVGKSFVSIALAARLSRGELLPFSEGPPVKCDSLFLSAEDPVAQAIRPRADANGADASRIFILDELEFDPQSSIARLKQAIDQNHDIRLVVLDPLNAFLKSGTDYFRDPDIRRSLLRPLSDFAGETGAAVLGVVHMSKRDDGGALSRVSGSLAYGAAARSVLGVGLDPNDEARHLLAAIKANYSKKPGTIAFRLSDSLELQFEAGAVDIDAEDIFQKRDQESVQDRTFGSEWLAEFLKNGPEELDSIRKAAEKSGLKERSLFRSRKSLGVVSKTQGFGRFKSSTWELPHENQPQK